MKINQDWNVPLICGTALCTLTAVVILVKIAGLRPSDVGDETNEELRFIDDYVSVIDKAMSHDMDVLRRCRDLQDRVMELPDASRRVEAACVCSGKFLAIEVADADCDRWVMRVRNYLNAAAAISHMMRTAGVGDRERVEFVFKAFDRYREGCLAPIPKEAEMDDDAWRKWDNRAKVTRSHPQNFLSFVERNLFKDYLPGLGDPFKSEVRSRFSAYHVSLTQEVTRVESCRGQRKRNCHHSEARSHDYKGDRQQSVVGWQ